MKRALLLGSYGQTNLGDDLLMYNYVRFLQDRGYREIIVNANKAENIPKFVMELAPKLRVIETYRSTPFEFIKQILATDIIVYGGGTVFKELYSSTGRSPYSVTARILAFNLVARLFNKPIYNLHIGTGSIKTTLGKIITKLCLRLSTLTIFRDRTSYEYARKELRVPSAKIEYSTDGLFLNKIWQRPQQNAVLSAPKGRTIIGMNLLSDIPDWINRETYLTNMRDVINRLLEDKRNFVMLVPFQHAFNPNNDRIFMQKEILPYIENQKAIKLLDEVPLELASSYFHQFDVFIGMRFHSLLLATVNETPFVSISYDTKCTRFLEESNYPFAVQLETASSEALLPIYGEVLNNREHIKKQLRSISRENLKRASQHLERVKHR